MGWAERMETPATTVYFDFDVLYLNGHREFFTAQEGRDLITADNARLRVELRPSDDLREEIIVHHAAVAQIRTVKREVTQPHLTDGLKLVGVGAPDGV